MDTLMLSSSEKDLIKASELLKNGQVVGIPTETVYGLGADATNPKAVREIFRAKGRPMDNPLIVHISKVDDALKIAKNIPQIFFDLAEKFWSGALTMIVPKKDIIPYETSGGLDTVGIRMPSHPIAKRLIELSGVPISAPSANTSGYPSPTTAQHVLHDMNGKISAIVDGGECSVGVESTVICFDDSNTVRILRPGYITPQDLQTVAKNVILDKGILSEVNADEKVSSPGMKYKHYSPTADVKILEGNLNSFIEYVSKHNQDGVYSLIFESDVKNFPFKYLSYGDSDLEHAQQIFSKLRELDTLNAKVVYVRKPNLDGVGLAVYNRLIRASAFEIIKL
ncbi:MAG: threonylcarbamoyl-AMP synthase [Ruminococcus sp.]|nr:threonylcarbamoyl-AMP synthase [Ruminococcus sp.]MCD7801013.1 threonylcarbamoyl-AMP synthase [Ruminococcus sp.]